MDAEDLKTLHFEYDAHVVEKMSGYFEKMKQRSKDRKDTVMRIWLEQLENLVNRGFVNGNKP